MISPTDPVRPAGDIDACPSCSGVRIVRWGSREARRPVVVDGRLGRETVEVPRLRCSCGHVWAVDCDPHPETGPIVARTVLELGYVDAARSLGVSVGTVRARFLDHVAGLSSRTSVAPDVLGVRRRRMGGAEWIVLTDDDETTFVDVLSRAADLVDWRSRFPGDPRLVVVELDPVTVGVVEGLFGRSDLGIPPALSVAAFRQAAARSFETVGDGRNRVPEADACFVPDADLDDAARDEVSQWSARRKAFRRACLRVETALATRDLAFFDRETAAAAATFEEIVPRSGVVAFLVRWRPIVRVGVRERWLDVVQSEIDEEVALRASRLRVPAGEDVVRAVVIHGLGPDGRAA